MTTDLLALSRFRRKPSSTPIQEQEECGVDVHVAVLGECDHGEVGEHGEGAEFQGGEGEGLSGEAVGMLGGEEREALYHRLQVVPLLLSNCVALVHGFSRWIVRLSDL
ncbi:hypothetical protein TIFTF001_005527 [Ficus carica]|uniref:Uncharacterized protein n=1 Tax=Ficus carica TaxID=3494 RepID=A0AA88CZI5_FICCA|nr:hypothetical protein TIFTF001_005527 [Ficus carica]